MDTFSYTSPISIERSWRIGLTNLQVYTSDFKITEGANNFKTYTFPDAKKEGTSFERLRNQVEKDSGFQILHTSMYKMK